MAILKRCGNCGGEFNAKHEHDGYCGSCRGLPKEDDAVIFAVYGMDNHPTSQPPYPWCIGAPTVAACVENGYCRRDPNCGE